MINFSLISTLLISLGLLLVLIFNTNPFTSNSFAISAFFAVLLVFLFSLFSLFSIFFAKLSKKQKRLALIFRRCLLVSILVVGILAFSALEVLNFMSILTFAIALILVEFFFSSKKVEKNIK